MLKKYRSNQFSKALQKKKAGIKREVINRSFEHSGSFLLLFDCTTEEKYNEYIRIASNLQVNNKKVIAIGFHGLTATPNYCTPSMQTVYIGKNDISSNGIPAGDLLDDFLKQPVDVLIDLTHCMHPVMQWIITLSVARLKIGSTEDATNELYDITIRVESKVAQEEMLKLAIQFQDMFQNQQL